MSSFYIVTQREVQTTTGISFQPRDIKCHDYCNTYSTIMHHAHLLDFQPLPSGLFFSTGTFLFHYYEDRKGLSCLRKELSLTEERLAEGTMGEGVFSIKGGSNFIG